MSDNEETGEVMKAYAAIYIFLLLTLEASNGRAQVDGLGMFKSQKNFEIPEKPPSNPAAAAQAASTPDVTNDSGITAEAQLVQKAAAEVERLYLELDGASHKANLPPNHILLPKSAVIEIAGGATSYARTHGFCVKAQSTASGLCREKENPKLQESLQQINMLAGMMNGMSLFDACSTMGKIMKISQMGLVAYTTACSTARAACEASCSNTWNGYVRMGKAVRAHETHLRKPCELATLGPLSPDPQAANKEAFNSLCVKLTVATTQTLSSALANSAPDMDENNPISIAAKNKACTYTYTGMLLNAGFGMLSLMQQLKQARQCDKQTDGTGTESKVQTLEEKCKDPKNADQPDCICLANPRTVGCANGLQKPGEYSANGFTGGAGLDGSRAGGDRTLANTGGPDIPNLDNIKNNNSDSGGGGVPAPSGGGSPLGGGGGLNGGGGATAAGAGEKKGLSADILGSGGGGGGGNWGGYGSASTNEKYRPFLPGGEKDPNKGLAGQQQWTKEVTGQGGRSNWEKIKQRYIDNRNTLIGN